MYLFTHSYINYGLLNYGLLMVYKIRLFSLYISTCQHYFLILESNLHNLQQVLLLHLK